MVEIIILSAAVLVLSYISWKQGKDIEALGTDINITTIALVLTIDHRIGELRDELGLEALETEEGKEQYTQ